MRLLLASSLLLLSLPIGAGEANFEFGFIYREFDSDVFGNADEQGGLVARFDFGGRYVRPALGVSYTAAESRNELALVQPFDDEASTWDVSGGMLVSNFAKRLRPYAGVGLSGTWIKVELLQSTGVAVVDRDFSGGLYVNTGFVWMSRKDGNITVGADLRYQAGQDIEILGQSGDSDFVQVGIAMGFRISN